MIHFTRCGSCKITEESINKLQETMNDDIIESIRKDYENLTRFLIERNLTITTMESATAGLIASLITDTEGASAIMKGAFITYSNEAKILQGVPKEIIDKYSVYSAETASAMARAAADKLDADIGIGLTGTMGNIDPKNPKNSVPGEVYFAIIYQGETTSYHISIPPKESRLEYKMAAAKAVYDEICARCADGY